ncbi:MAG: RNA recognition motif domain-containing protein, partial [Chitinophagales bacterium]
MNIFVAKLNFDTTEEDLRDLFEEFGAVDTVKIVMNRDTGRSKGFGFVEMPNDDEAGAAIEELNECEFDHRTIVVKKAEPRENRGRGGFNRGRDNNRGGGGGRGGWNDRSGGNDRRSGGRDRRSGGGSDRGDRGGSSRGSFSNNYGARKSGGR